MRVLWFPAVVLVGVYSGLFCYMRSVVVLWVSFMSPIARTVFCAPLFSLLSYVFVRLFLSFFPLSFSRHVQKDIAKKRYLRKHLLWEVLQSDEHSRNDTEK